MLEAYIANEYVRAIVTLIVAMLLAKFAELLIKKYLRRAAAKTKTEIDDIIVDKSSRPIFYLLLLGGLYFSLKTLSVLMPYTQLLDGAFFVIATLIVARMFAKIIEALVPHWMRVQKRFEKTPQLISKIVGAAIYLIALLVVLDHFHIAITPLIATLGLGGLAIGLALKDTLSNFFAGLHIISDRPIIVGDFIEVNGFSGYVEDIGWRSTKIRTIGNIIVVIPNAKLSESTIVNYSRPTSDLSVPVECGVGYGSDLEKVEKVTLDVARRIQQKIEGAVKDYEPAMRYKEFGDSNINFVVYLRAADARYKTKIAHEFIKALKARYDKEGIEISWPVRKVFMEK